MRRLTALFVVLLCASAFAQPPAPIVLRAARWLDVSAGQVRAPAVVVVQDGRIASVGGEIPPGARAVDLGDVTLLPGLIDVHTHLTGDIEGDWVTRDVRELPADAALRGARNAKRTLEAGFTTVRNLGAGGFADIALMKAIDSGMVPGPRMIASAHALGITGGHCDVTGWAPGILEGGPEEGIVDGVDAAVRGVRYQIKHGARVIKICATAGVLSFDATVGAQQLSDDEMRAIVEETTRHGLKVAAHAHGTQGILAAVKAGVASIEHGSMLNDEIIALMKKKGTYLVPTAYLLTAMPLNLLPPPIAAKAKQIIPLAQESHRQAVKAGVKIAFGTDTGVSDHGKNAQEFALLVKAGLTPAGAIKAATLDAATLLDRVATVGSIEPGKDADIIAVATSPLNDVTELERVRFVMRRGVVHRLDGARQAFPID